MVASAVTRNAAAGVDHAVMIGSRVSQLRMIPVAPTPIEIDHTHDPVNSGLRPATLAAWNTKMKVPP
ncbi:hypothetical protein D3C71_1621280 [compost metagenome]